MVKIRECKKEVRIFLRENFSLLFFLAFILSLAELMQNIIIRYFSTAQIFYSDTTLFKRFLVFFVLPLLNFFVTPIIKVTFFKIVVLARNERRQEIKVDLKRFLTVKNIVRIFVFSFIPSLMDLFFDINRISDSVLNFSELKGIPLIILSIISFFISYKLFALGYIFALRESSIKETFLSSLRVMRKSIGSFIKLLFAYIHWDFIVALIILSIKTAVYGASFYFENTYTPLFDSFAAAGFGLGIFLSVLSFSITAIFIDKLLKSTETEKSRS